MFSEQTVFAIMFYCKRRINMKTIKVYAIAVSLLFIAAGCAVTDIDRTANFYNYRSFDWGKPVENVDDPVYKSELITKNIRSTVEKEFAKRGITRDKTDPDFIVSYHTYTKEKQGTRNRNYGYGPFAYGPFFPWRFYSYYYGWGFPYGYPEQTSYTEGTLIVDITDSKTDELVWRGTVKGNVDNISSLQKQIQKGIKAILKKYPVTPQEPLTLPDEKVIS